MLDELFLETLADGWTVEAAVELAANGYQAAADMLATRGMTLVGNSLRIDTANPAFIALLLRTLARTCPEREPGVLYMRFELVQPNTGIEKWPPIPPAASCRAPQAGSTRPTTRRRPSMKRPTSSWRPS